MVRIVGSDYRAALRAVITANGKSGLQSARDERHSRLFPARASGLLEPCGEREPPMTRVLKS